jgi:threonine dehydrogenase-like Zn-dependent dehydrogenase
MGISIAMQALFYSVNPVGWATCKWLRHIWEGCLLSRLNGLTLRDVPAPELPGSDWVRLRTLMGGICGTDLAIVAQKQRPNSILQAFSSLPAVMGHENVAIVEDAGSDAGSSWLGRRVCVEPALCCVVRGIDPPCRPCRRGEYGACESFAADGAGAAGLPPGTSIGYNRRTGGSFGQQFVAHQSQLVPVPEGMSDELAVLTDPVACSLHAVLGAELSDAERVLVYGSGVLGLGVIACLRAVGCRAGIDALDRTPWLEELARGLGADEYLQLPAARRQRFARIAERTGATVQRARFGNYMLSGGYDVVFECVGSRQSIEESLKWTRARGQVVMVATGHGGGADLTPIWFRELRVVGRYGRQLERYNGRRVGTYELVHELMESRKLDVAPLLTHTFRLAEWREALRVGMHKSAHRAVKVAFDFR